MSQTSMSPLEESPASFVDSGLWLPLKGGKLYGVDRFRNNWPFSPWSLNYRRSIPRSDHVPPETKLRWRWHTQSTALSWLALGNLMDQKRPFERSARLTGPCQSSHHHRLCAPKLPDDPRWSSMTWEGGRKLAKLWTTLSGDMHIKWRFWVTLMKCQALAFCVWSSAQFRLLADRVTTWIS